MVKPTSQGGTLPAHWHANKTGSPAHESCLGGTGALGGRGGPELRFADQRRDCRHSARRILCRRDARRVDLVRHSRHRQHCASRLHHPRLLHRLHREHPTRHRPDRDQYRHAAGVLFPGRRHLSSLLRVVRAARAGSAARPVFLLRPAVRHRGDAHSRFRRRLPLRRSPLYRAELAARRDGFPAAHAGTLRSCARALRRARALPVVHVRRTRHLRRGAGPACVAAHGRLPDPHQAHRLRHFHCNRRGRGCAADHHPAGRALGRTRIYRPGVRDLRAWGARQPSRHGDRRDAARHHRELHRHLLRAVVGAGGGVRRPPSDPRVSAGGSSRTIGLPTVRTRVFLLISIAVAAVVFFGARLVNNDYVFFAGYTRLQFIVLATAWNILGGYTGYVNFGSAAFFALGAYATVFLHKFYPLPIPLLIVIGGVVSGMGYLTLRLRGAFFAIATLALAVVLQTLVVNWDYVGGSRGAYIIRPNDIAVIGPYIQYLFLLMLALVVIALTIARGIERSQLGYGFATIRDDELAAEASGVPTLRLKLVATTLSGALMGMAGAPFPYYIGYLQPSSAFGLEYAVNSIAMPMIGGTTSWVGPLIGAILLGSLQQLATVTISSAVNLLIVGLLLVGSVIIAPNGIVGLVQNALRRKNNAGKK